MVDLNNTRLDSEEIIESSYDYKNYHGRLD